jgi:hypothetical protein
MLQQVVADLVSEDMAEHEPPERVGRPRHYSWRRYIGAS